MQTVVNQPHTLISCSGLVREQKRINQTEFNEHLPYNFSPVLPFNLLQDYQSLFWHNAQLHMYKKENKKSELM